MNIFVVSDTHGHLEKVYHMYEALTGANIDLIIHCGDYGRDGATIGERLGKPVISVRGNCDGAGRDDYLVYPTDYGKILVVHGHYQGVQYDLGTLSFLAREQDCILACFGHTHIPVVESHQGITFMNPGSLPLPRDGSSGSCGLVTLDEKGARGDIYYYDTYFPGKENKRSRGGFLRGIVNYSDRL